jgi:hypothetical protein
MEVSSDGSLYYTYASKRGLLGGEQFIMSTATKTLTADATDQNIFTQSFTFTSSTSYFFECYFVITGLNATAGSIGFGLSLASGSISQISYTAITKKNNGLTTTAAAFQVNIVTNTASQITNSVAGTTVVVFIKGILRTTATGVLNPTVNQITTNAAATIGRDAYFRFTPIGTSSILSITGGAWA